MLHCMNEILLTTGIGMRMKEPHWHITLFKPKEARFLPSQGSTV
jgi:hypothetical protein